MNAARILLYFATGGLLGMLGARVSSSRPPAPAPALASAASAQANASPATANDESSTTGAGHDTSDRMARLFSGLKEPFALARRYALEEALRGMPAGEFAGLMERAARVPPDVAQPYRVAVMIAWFRADATAAGEWMRAHQEQSDGVEAWGRSDPQGTIREALANPNLARSKRLLFCAVEQLAGKNPAAMTAKLEEVPAGPLREEVMVDVVTKWADTEPRAAFGATDRIAPGAMRDGTREKVLLSWAGRDPAAALLQAEALLPTLAKEITGSLFLTRLAQVAAEKNPPVALAWLDRLPPEHRSSAAAAGLTAWAAKDPLAALRWGLAHDVSVTRGSTSAMDRPALGEAMARAPEESWALLESLPPSLRRESLMERAVTALRIEFAGDRIEPAQAALLRRALPQLSPDALRSVASQLSGTLASRQNLTDLNPWLQVFPDGPARAAALQSAVLATTARDSNRAGRLIEQLSDPRERDQALNSSAMMLVGRQPQEAVRRAALIQDESRRASTLKVVQERWQQKDPAAYETWQQSQPK